MVKDMEIRVVPMVMIKTTAPKAAMIILGVTMRTTSMDRDVQATVGNRALKARYLEWVAITKNIISHTKGGHWRKLEKIAKVTHLAG